WEVGLAQDLPWNLLISAHVGQLDVDLRGLEVKQAYIASGIGDVSVICPAALEGTFFARSTFGDVHLIVPKGVAATIRVKTGPFCRIIRHSRQFIEQADRLIVTESYEPGA